MSAEIHYSGPLEFVSWGPLAQFTKPGFRSDRSTFLVPPPTAAEGMVKSIAFHPEAQVHKGEKCNLAVEISEIQVLNPIDTVRVRTNEIDELPHPDQPYYVHGSIGKKKGTRRQTSNILLVDPMYRIKFRYLSFRADFAEKFFYIFKRRLAKGQCFRQMAMGRRRYVGYSREVCPQDVPLDINMDLGFIPWHIDYHQKTERGRTRTEKTLHTFQGRLIKGTLKVPSYFKSRLQSGQEINL